MSEKLKHDDFLLPDGFVNVSLHGLPWKPLEPGESLHCFLDSREWAGSGSQMFPVAKCVEAETGELYSLRIDTAMLRVLGLIPLGTEMLIVFRGLAKSNKGNDMKVFTVATKGKVELLDENFIDLKPVQRKRKGRKK